MPSKTTKQRNFMGMCYGNPSTAHKKCPPKNVSREFARADARRAKRNAKY